MFNHLYQAPPDGFSMAIEIGEQYLHDYGDSSDAERIWFYLASAYGQRHAWQKAQGATEDELRQTAQLALNAATKAVEYNSTWRPMLRRMWDGSDYWEDDLNSLRDDDGFRRLFTAVSN